MKNAHYYQFLPSQTARVSIDDSLAVRKTGVLSSSELSEISTEVDTLGLRCGNLDATLGVRRCIPTP